MPTIIIGILSILKEWSKEPKTLSEKHSIIRRATNTSLKLSLNACGRFAKGKSLCFFAIAIARLLAQLLALHP